MGTPAASTRPDPGGTTHGRPLVQGPAGWVTFAAILLAIGGALNVIYGIAAIADSSFFIADQRYIVSDLNTWGWVAIVVGVCQGFAAYSLLGGGLYGRIVAIVAATLSAIASLLSIPAYPLWSLAIFALDIIIIHQVATRGAEQREDRAV